MFNVCFNCCLGSSQSSFKGGACFGSMWWCVTRRGGASFLAGASMASFAMKSTVNGLMLRATSVLATGLAEDFQWKTWAPSEGAPLRWDLKRVLQTNGYKVTGDSSSVGLHYKALSVVYLIFFGFHRIWFSIFKFLLLFCLGGVLALVLWRPMS